jgi:Flp pilus assembly pilin Flp
LISEVLNPQKKVEKFRSTIPYNRGGCIMKNLLAGIWRDEQGQDIAEYAVMLAVILVIVVGTIRMVGSNANNVFSNVASSVQ